MPTLTYLAYALPALPLALFALPLYVHVPKLYADGVGLSLTAVGSLLLGARLLDALIDPWLGRWSDGQSRQRMLLLAMPLLIAGGYLLFVPPADAGLGHLGGGLALAYLGYSLASINHQAWGAEFAVDEHGRLAANAWREGAGLCGVLIAAILPSLLAGEQAYGVAALLWCFIPLLVLSTAVAIWRVPGTPTVTITASAGVSPWRDAAFVRLLGVFALNGVAAAIPATLVLFYVADVLQAEAWSGVFLFLYFLTGALAMPVWVALAQQYGRVRIWQAAMLLAMLGFAVTPWLGAGDVFLFGLVCVASGMTLGADLALPPALLAEQVARHGHAATRYGWWTATSKFNLALAAGVALPLVGALGYVPGQLTAGTQGLAMAYGGLPLLLKLAAFLLLWRVRLQLAIFDQGVSR